MVMISGENVSREEIKSFLEETMGNGLTDNFAQQSLVHQAQQIPGVTVLSEPKAFS